MGMREEKRISIFFFRLCVVPLALWNATKLFKASTICYLTERG